MWYTIYRIHVPSGNQLTGSYFCSVTGYDMLASFTALAYTTSTETIKGKLPMLTTLKIQLSVSESKVQCLTDLTFISNSIVGLKHCILYNAQNVIAAQLLQ